MLRPPSALPADPEDVAWALQTADALWARGERADAIVWVRRAAQAAGEVEEDDRAVLLARRAAELSEWVSNGGHADDDHEELDVTMAEGSIHDVDEADLHAGEADADVDALLNEHPSLLDAEPFDLVVPSAGSVTVQQARMASEYPTSTRSMALSDAEVMTVSLSAPDIQVEPHATHGSTEPPEGDSETDRPGSMVSLAEISLSDSVPPEAHDEAAEVSSDEAPPGESAPPPSSYKPVGILDPWSEEERRSRLPPQRVRGFEDEEVVTSAKSRPVPFAPAGARVPRPSSVVASPSGTLPPMPLPRPAPLKPAFGGGLAPPRPLGPPVDARVRPREPSVSDEMATREFQRLSSPVAPSRATLPGSPPPVRDGAARPALSPPAPAVAARPMDSAPPTEPSPHVGGGDGEQDEAEATIVTRAPHEPPVLDDVAALSDLPDDVREAFARTARVVDLVAGAAVPRFGLLLVLEGVIDVAAARAKSTGLRLSAGAVLRARGTMDRVLPLRLASSSHAGVAAKARIAVWNDEAVNAAFGSCPWVEDDLRAIADEVHARAGVAIGLLGDRLDLDMRELVTKRLTVRALDPGEEIATGGKPLPGIVILGAGDIVLEGQGAARPLKPGDFLYPSEVLASAAAPGTARAGAHGALILFGNRTTAQDLLMSVPPLLEVLASA